MPAALTAPVLTAAGLLVVSGLVKLRAPAPAARALAVAGIPLPPGLVRIFSAGELALGLFTLAVGGRAAAALLAAVYGLFALLTVILVRRRSACGCFGESDVPAAPVQAVLSAVIAATCLVALLHPTHALAWVLERSPATAITLVAGSVAAVYAAMLAYTELPAAWAAWSGR